MVYKLTSNIFPPKGRSENNYSKIKKPYINRDYSVAILGPGSEPFPEARIYEDIAYSVANDLAKSNYNIITGGGHGVMQAGNKGAHDADNTDSKSWAIDVKKWINRPSEKIYNVLDQVESGPQRTEKFADNAKFAIMFNGGPGTWEEWGVLMEKIFYGNREKGDKFPQRIFIIDWNSIAAVVKQAAGSVYRTCPFFSECVKFVNIDKTKEKFYKYKKCQQETVDNPSIQNIKEAKESKKEYKESIEAVKKNIAEEIKSQNKVSNLNIAV